MNDSYKDWRTCDICGSEGMCRPASDKEVAQYDAEDVCQRCDSEVIVNVFVIFYSEVLENKKSNEGEKK